MENKIKAGILVCIFLLLNATVNAQQTQNQQSKTEKN